MSYLGEILGSETKIKLLFTLVNNSQLTYTEKELAKKSASSVSEVNRQIPRLVKAGIISMQRIGRTKAYSINQKHFLFPPLRKLFIGLSEIYKKVAREIKDAVTKKFKSIQAIILIGSLAEGRLRDDIVEEPSDIDLIFIVKKTENVREVKKNLINYINKDISLKYGIALYPFVISKQEYLNRLRKKDLFILETYIKGEVIYGRKPRRSS